MYKPTHLPPQKGGDPGGRRRWTREGGGFRRPACGRWSSPAAKERADGDEKLDLLTGSDDWDGGIAAARTRARTRGADERRIGQRKDEGKERRAGRSTAPSVTASDASEIGRRRVGSLQPQEEAGPRRLETKAGARGRRKRKGPGRAATRAGRCWGQGMVAGGGRGQGADERDSGGGRGVVVQRREAARGGEQPPRHGNRRRAVRKPEWWTEQGQWHL
jgi:hypothetical protein